MHAEAPAVPHLPGRVRQHDVARRITDRLADALDDDEQRRNLPGAREREQWHRGHLDEITNERNRPELLCPFAQSPRDESQRVSEQLTEARDNPDDGSTGAQDRQKRSCDPARPLVGEIGKEADDAGQQHESECGATRRCRYGDRHGIIPLRVRGPQSARAAAPWPLAPARRSIHGQEHP